MQVCKICKLRVNILVIKPFFLTEARCMKREAHSLKTKITSYKLLATKNELRDTNYQLRDTSYELLSIPCNNCRSLKFLRICK